MGEDKVMQEGKIVEKWGGGWVVASQSNKVPLLVLPPFLQGLVWAGNR